uniref:Formin-like protein 2-like n=1 Tax=Saccoglossus kowalevskii TaxID=10224 RepID=A0ABM0M0E5_SACKO|nr:PREDICTED: formin-like protein 2-like [Saccoglossus kowalevskii]
MGKAAPAPSNSADFYVEQLKRHMHPKLHATKKITKKQVQGLTPVQKILKSLSDDLSNFDTQFLVDFISEPNNGMEVLIDFLHDIQLYHNEGIPFAASHGTRKSSATTIPKRYSDTISRQPKDSLNTLMCIIDIVETNEEALRLVLASKKSMETFLLCLMSNSMKLRIGIVNLLRILCTNKDGHDYVMNMMTYMKLKMGETTRFKLLISLIHADPPNRNYQLACLRLLNELLNSTDIVNERVYLQYELIELAKFDPYKVQESLQGEYDEDISQELERWHTKFINIESLHEDYTELDNRNKLLRTEIDIQKREIQKLEMENANNKQKYIEAKAENEEHRIKIAMLQDKLGTTVSKDVDENFYDETQVAVIHTLDQAIEDGNNITETESIASTRTDDIYDDVENRYTETPVEGGVDDPDVAPLRKPSVKLSKRHAPPVPPPLPGIGNLPPAPPPPPSAQGLNNEKRKQPINANVPLPMFNWVPMTTAGNTIFKGIDEENIYEEFDFSDFEANFHTKRRQSVAEQNAVLSKLERARKRIESQVTVIESNRAKNLIITRRRIKLNDREIKSHITNCDISGVPGEIAELLLNFVPSREELRGLAKNADRYEEMGEAEKFMFKMARIDRYESRLRLMVFMGIYDDLISTVRPIMDTKSTDRQHTLLNYIATTTRNCYPAVALWYEDLEVVKDAVSVSLESISTDVHGLRKGLELTRFERDKQEDNPVISISFLPVYCMHILKCRFLKYFSACLNNDVCVKSLTDCHAFYTKASEKVFEVSKLYTKMEESYRNACALFGENSKTIQPSDFFTYFSIFMDNYKKAIEDIKNTPFNPSLKPVTMRVRRSLTTLAEVQSEHTSGYVNASWDTPEAPRPNPTLLSTHLQSHQGTPGHSADDTSTVEDDGDSGFHTFHSENTSPQPQNRNISKQNPSRVVSGFYSDLTEDSVSVMATPPKTAHAGLKPKPHPVYARYIDTVPTAPPPLPERNNARFTSTSSENKSTSF